MFSIFKICDILPSRVNSMPPRNAYLSAMTMQARLLVSQMPGEIYYWQTAGFNSRLYGAIHLRRRQ